MSETDAERTAVLSDCGTYRYRLTRRWASGPCDVWVMLNPSTADAELDDPTIRRCVGFSRGWGSGSLSVVNLFALRATDPEALRRHPDPVGPDNDGYLRSTFAVARHSGGRIVTAWGAHRMAGWRAREVARLFGGDWSQVHGAVHLGTTKAGAPKHPLYLRADLTPTSWAATP